jgi:hypothetical protein
VGAGRAGYALDLRFCKAEYFSREDLTRFRETEGDLPVVPGMSHWRHPAGRQASDGTEGDRTAFHAGTRSMRMS